MMFHTSYVYENKVEPVWHPGGKLRPHFSKEPSFLTQCYCSSLTFR